MQQKQNFPSKTKSKKKNRIFYSESWRFDENVSINFDEHVNNSVPYYNDIQNYIAEISKIFIRKNSSVYDIGCSTGNSIISISKLNLKLNVEIIGIEKSRAMVQLAKAKIKKIKKARIIKKDILNYNLKKCDLIIICLTLPFLTLENRKKIIKKCYNSLVKKGGLIIVDKLKCESVDLENIFIDIYHDFKLKKLSASEILRKRKSLQTAMTLQTYPELIDTLKTCNFKKDEIFFKFLNFIGIVCTK